MFSSWLLKKVMITSIYNPSTLTFYTRYPPWNKLSVERIVENFNSHDKKMSIREQVAIPTYFSYQTAYKNSVRRVTLVPRRQHMLLYITKNSH